jgi:phosphoribosylformimino-5-aminoimidazole carboxamide ribotide isomerase
VKQIVGGSLAEDLTQLRTNFISDKPAAWFAERYRTDGLGGGHVVMLGPGCEEQARQALLSYPGGLQVGGGVNLSNARQWIDAGASHVIVTSWVFREGRLDWERLKQLVQAIGKDKLVLDLSCRRRGEEHIVVSDRFQKFTELRVNRSTLEMLSEWCAEFLVHGVDVEGLCQGIDKELVQILGEWAPLSTTYAGGARDLSDLDEVHRLGKGRVDLTIGSALDIFGGTGVRYQDAVAWNRRHSSSGH